MKKTIQVNIVSLEEDIFAGAVEMVVVTTLAGEIGIMPGHIPLLAMIKPGQIRLSIGSSYEIYYVSGGVIEVQPETVTILADTVKRARDSDEAAALVVKNNAESVLAGVQTDTDFAEALAQIAHAVAQLRNLHLAHINKKQR